MTKKFTADGIIWGLYWEAYYSDEVPRPPHELWESVLGRLNYCKRCLLNPEKERETIRWRRDHGESVSLNDLATLFTGKADYAQD